MKHVSPLALCCMSSVCADGLLWLKTEFLHVLTLILLLLLQSYAWTLYLSSKNNNPFGHYSDSKETLKNTEGMFHMVYSKTIEVK